MDDRAVGASVGPVVQSWSSTDCILYALGVGCGSESLTDDLAFTTENSEGRPQRVLPTYPLVVAARLRDIYEALGSIDWTKVVHGEQSIEIHRPLHPDDQVLLTTRIADIYDKGTSAVVHLQSEGRDAASGEPVFTTRAGLFFRDAGGWGGDRGPASAGWTVDGDPRWTVRHTTAPNQALLYRLSGDRNPLHSDPSRAEAAGFSRPILHGLCTFGYAGRALLDSACDGHPERFLGMSGRFSRPVYPGDALNTRVWPASEAGNALFDVCLDDGTPVIAQGRFSYRAAT